MNMTKYAKDYVDACDREAFARFMEESEDLEAFMKEYEGEDEDLKLLNLNDPID